MADPIREALKRLLAVIKPKYTDPDEIVAVVRAMAAARTALAAEPTLIASEPSDEDLADLAEVFNGDSVPAMRRALELWGRPTVAALAAEPPAPDPREALAARPLLEAVARMGDRIGQHTVGEIRTISDRAAAWLREHAPGQPVAIEPRGCPTPGACSCVEPPAPAPTADGERDHVPGAGNMVPAAYAACLRQCPTHGQLPANAWGCPECLRELREELPPKGLTPEEYFHADSGARIVREPCDGEPGWCWTVSNSRHVNPCTEFPTLAAAWEAVQQARRQEVGDE